MTDFVALDIRVDLAPFTHGIGGTIARQRPAPTAPLLDRARAGDADALVELLKEQDPALRRLAYSITGSAATMDDVLQEAYIKAFRSIRSFKGASAFSTWIYRIVVNAAIDEGRKHARVLPFDDVAKAAAAPVEVDPDVAQRLDIRTALARLPEAQRTVVLLVDGEGFDYRTAAEILGIPEGTVSSRINQARTTLRRLLGATDEGGRR